MWWWRWGLLCTRPTLFIFMIVCEQFLETNRYLCRLYVFLFIYVLPLEIQLSRLGGICCFSVKHAALWRKSKDWLARSQDNVSESGTMSIDGLVLQLTSNKQYNLECWSSTQQTSSSSSHWKLTLGRHLSYRRYLYGKVCITDTSRCTAGIVIWSY
jgi:hypothetical protein